MGLPGPTNDDVAVRPRNAYLPPGGFPSYTAAMAAAKARTGICTIWVHGASVAAGGSAITDMLTKSYFARFRAAVLAAGYPLHGDTMLTTVSTNFNSGVTYSVAPFTMDVSPAGWSFFGPVIAPLWVTATTMPLVHYIHPSVALGYNARSFRVSYWDGGNQDGGTNTAGRTWDITETIDTKTNNITNLGDNLIHTSDITNLTNVASHRLNIGNQGAASSAALPLAVSSYPGITIGTYGVHFVWAGLPGSFCLGDLAYTGGTGPALRIERDMGPVGSAVPFAPNVALSPPWAPDMVILDMFDDLGFVNLSPVVASGSNPTYNPSGIPPDAYKHALMRKFQTWRAKSTGCDVVHHLPNLADALVADVAPSATYVLQNSVAYYDIHRQLAEKHGHGVLDSDAEWGERGVALGYLTAGNPHPNDAGHAEIATRLSTRMGLI